MSGQGTSQTLPAPGAPRVQFVEDFFVYNVNTGPLTTGLTVNGNFQILADSDFKLIKLAVYASVAEDSGFTSTPNASIQINDSGSGRNLFAAPIPIPSIFGSGQLPFIMPIPRIFKARSNVVVTVANIDPSTQYDNVFLAFIGTKIFQLGQ